MELKAFLSRMSPEEREAFAKSCGTTLGHLRNVSYGKSCNAGLASDIELYSRGAVTRRELRSDWKRIWPDLSKKVRA